MREYNVLNTYISLIGTPNRPIKTNIFTSELRHLASHSLELTHLWCVSSLTRDSNLGTPEYPPGPIVVKVVKEEKLQTPGSVRTCCKRRPFPGSLRSSSLSFPLSSSSWFQVFLFGKDYMLVTRIRCLLCRIVCLPDSWPKQLVWPLARQDQVPAACRPRQLQAWPQDRLAPQLTHLLGGQTLWIWSGVFPGEPVLLFREGERLCWVWFPA